MLKMITGWNNNATYVMSQGQYGVKHYDVVMYVETHLAGHNSVE